MQWFPRLTVIMTFEIVAYHQGRSWIGSCARIAVSEWEQFYRKLTHRRKEPEKEQENATGAHYHEIQDAIPGDDFNKARHIRIA